MTRLRDGIDPADAFRGGLADYASSDPHRRGEDDATRAARISASPTPKRDRGAGLPLGFKELLGRKARAYLEWLGGL